MMTYLLLWSALLLSVTAKHKEGNFVILITAVNTTSDGRYFDANVTHDKSGLEMNVTILKDLNPDDVFLRMVSGMKIGVAARYSPFVNGKQVNLCEFNKKPTLDHFLNIMITEMISHSNWTTQCPVRKGYFELRNLDLRSTKMIPSFAPLGKYMANFAVSRLVANSYKILWQTHIYFSLLPK